MNGSADQTEAAQWEREASEELRATRVIAEHGEIPDRVAGFHAHLAAEKAMKDKRDRLLTRDEVLARGKPFPPYEEIVIEGLTDEEEEAFLNAIAEA